MPDFVSATIAAAAANVEAGGRPFACLIVQDDKIVAEATNQVAQTQDPTAHAEIVAIREACRRTGSEHLYDCDIYVLAHPCPMCLGALYYCSPRRVIFVVEREEYVAHYRDDRRYFSFAGLYPEYGLAWNERSLPMEHAPTAAGLDVYRRWNSLNPDDPAAV